MFLLSRVGEMQPVVIKCKNKEIKIFVEYSRPAPRQFMKELLVQYLIAVFAPHWEEDVTSNELVENFAFRRDTLEDDVLFIAKLNHHVTCLPVDVPSLKHDIG